jgi:hypothetical protein
MFWMIVALINLWFLFATAQSVTTITNLCGQTGANAPYCVVYREACSSSSTAPICSEDSAVALLVTMCNSEFKDSSYCTEINNNCAQTNCTVNNFFENVPTSVEATNLIQGICTDMPGMALCSTCPAPVDGVSNCNLLSTYMGLCGVHDMTQCNVYDQICMKAVEEEIELPNLCAKFHDGHDHGESSAIKVSTSFAVIFLLLALL